MNNKYYTFLILIFLLLFLLYNIVIHKYEEYKISEHIKVISNLNTEIEDYILTANDIIKYKKSEAYKNKILKQDNLKNKAEIVVYLKHENQYNKFVKETEEINILKKDDEKILDETFWMTIYQKWMWFLFKKDAR